MVNLATHFPPIGSTCSWRQVIDGRPRTVQAVAKRWRPSGQMRVYTFDVEGKEERGVVDYDPDANRLTVALIGAGNDHSFTIEHVRNPT